VNDPVICPVRQESPSSPKNKEDKREPKDRGQSVKGALLGIRWSALEQLDRGKGGEFGRAEMKEVGDVLIFTRSIEHRSGGKTQ